MSAASHRPAPPLLEEPSDLSREVSRLLEEGLSLCRRERWEEGLARLGSLLAEESRSDLPGVFYSTLGYGVARFQKRYRDGIRLCEHGVKKQFYEAENYYNLARTRLLVGDRRRGIWAIHKGLRMDPRHEGLSRMRADLGVRRQPVVSFLDRANPVNRFLGRLRILLGV